MFIRSSFFYLGLLFLTFNTSFAVEDRFKAVYIDIANSNFEEAFNKLDKLNIRSAESDYLKGLSSFRVGEYDRAEKYFQRAIDKKFDAKDIYYEYAQVLYTQNKLIKALNYFKESVKKKYKVGVSLYYLAYISQERKDYKKAISFYKMIEKLPKDKKKDVLQASRMQIADIYLAQVQKVPDSFQSIDKYVIPQYEKALDVDKKSALADDIRKKIFELQSRYDLVLFKMRNGRPTARPPYFLKANILYGQDSNVNILDDDSRSELEDKDIASAYYNAGFFGRYTFYPNNIVSVSPELSFSYTKYLSDSERIKINNNYALTSGLKFNFEHEINKKPATTYLGINFTQNFDDEDADDSLEKRDTTWRFSLSEEMNLWKRNTSTISVSYSDVKGVEEENTNNLTSFSLEQLIFFGKTTFFFYTSYDLTRYTLEENEVLNTNGLSFRLDLILPTFMGLFNPSFYYGTTSTDYYENEDRGETQKSSYGVILNRPLSKKWYLTFDGSFEQQTGGLETDVYDKTIVSVYLDYIF